MKLVLSICCVLIGFSSMAQKDTVRVSQNKEKISELNERLDNLLKEDIQLDSIDIKIDYLMKEMKAIRTELKQLNTEVDGLKAGQSELSKNKNLADPAIDSSSYYVVLASERDEFLAKRLFNQIKEKESAKLVRNDKKTWYHIILMQPMDMFGAIKVAKNKRGEAYPDCWWITGKKLIQN